MTAKLDDLKYIHQKDTFDSLGIVAKVADQIRHKFTLSGKTDFKNVYNVVYAAMGGSALAAQLVETWPSLGEPFQIVRGYDLPDYVDGDTLVICSSYSGNTEETLSALAQAEKKGAQIAVIAGGGKLQEEAKAKGYAFIQLPKTAQPRYAALYNYAALLEVLAAAGLVKKDEFTKALDEAADFVEQAAETWLPTVSAKDNPAKQLAQELLGQSVVIYSGPKMYPAAYRFKISVNENAKQVAWVGQYPEFNHNEFIGWSQQPVQKPYAVVDLRSNLEHPRVQKRFEVSERLLSGKRPAPIIVEAQGKTVLQQMLWLMSFSDFATIYLGLLNGIDPAPVELVEKLKKEMAK